MSGPAYLEPHGTDIHNGDEAWQHQDACFMCGKHMVASDLRLTHGELVCWDCEYQCDDGPRWCAECAEGVAR